MRTNWLCTAFSFAFLLATSGFEAQEKTFTDSVEVKVASVEVVVEDKDGNKIPGLTAADFEIFEDGKKQDLTYFSAQERGQPVIAGEDEPAGALPAALPTERVHLAIFIDDVHLSANNRNLVFGRLKEYLHSSLKPTDLVLIARISDRLTIEQPFTADAAALEATLDRLAKNAGAVMQVETQYRKILQIMASTQLGDDGMDEAAKQKRAASRVGIPKTDPNDFAAFQAAGQAREILLFSEERRIRVVASIKALSSAIGSLAGLPGRKALVYVSDGLPVQAAAGLAEAWRNKYEVWARNNGQRDLLSELSRVVTQSIDAQSELAQLGRDASAAKVAFYILSPGSTMARGIGTAELSGASTGGAGMTSTVAATETFESEAPLIQLADVTGGKARTRNMDIAALLDEVRDDFGTFYSLGYQPLDEARDGKRKVAIQVIGHPEARVRYTHTLGDQDPVEALRELTLSALYHGVTENPLQIELDPKPNPQSLGNDRFRVDVMVKVPFEKILLLPQEDSHVGRLTLFVVVKDNKNQNLSGMSRVEVPIQIPNDQLLTVMAQKAAYPLKLEMQGGPQRLAIGMRDHLARVSSTIEVDFEVPDSMAAVTAPVEEPLAEAPPAGGSSGGAR